jgi:magnesium-protoporphyrin IX monomethyl ester (oxidative) cyclase
MRADPKLLSGLNLWWIRFFQLAVFATMFVRDHDRPVMHKALGLNPTEYDMEVFRITTEISKQVFPVLLDIENPKFLSGLKTLRQLSEKSIVYKKNRNLISLILRGLLGVKVAFVFIRLYFMKPISNKLPTDLRLRPTW